jgi:SAM-dependent methyltransferase
MFNQPNQHRPNIYAYERQRRLELLLKAIASQRLHMALEAGCGAASALPALQPYLDSSPGSQLTGIDFHWPSLLEAQRNTTGQVSLVQSLAEELPFSANSFDIIIALGLIGYIERLDELFAEVQRTLKPDGLFIFTFPNQDSVYRRLRSRLRSLRPGPRRGIPAVPVSPAAIRTLAQAHALRLEQSSFITYGLGFITFPWSIGLSKFFEARFSKHPLGEKLAWSCICLARKQRIEPNRWTQS